VSAFSHRWGGGDDWSTSSGTKQNGRFDFRTRDTKFPKKPRGLEKLGNLPWEIEVSEPTSEDTSEKRCSGGKRGR